VGKLDIPEQPRDPSTLTKKERKKALTREFSFKNKTGTQIGQH